MDRPCEYGRWLWIELIGFDNEHPRFGVPEFLDRIGFTPDGVAFLLFNPEFVHAHDGMDQNAALAPDMCTYGGYAGTLERQRQQWTQHQLRGLVRELQSTGAKVFPSVGDCHTAYGPWLDDHPEVLHVSRTRGRLPRLCPWKHLADGRLYEDFFIPKLVEVLDDYGFDGFYGANGFNPPRISIYDGDFSWDMIEQFQKQAGVALPAELASGGDDDLPSVEARADWIWTNRRRQWIDFYVQRRAAFWRKLVAKLHARGKSVMVNSTWTKDPLESIYRFGVDYRLLAEAGIDRVVLEAAAAAMETIADPNPACRAVCQFAAATLLARASIPAMPMQWLNGVKDTNEDWDALRQAPMALESEIHAYTHLYRRTPAGELAHCVDGPMVCLADCIEPHQWQRLSDRWSLGFGFEPAHVHGVTLVWSNAVLDRQVDDMIATGRWSVHRWLSHLMARGAAVHTVVDIRDMTTVTGPILVLGAHLFPDSEREVLQAYDGGPMVVVSDDEVLHTVPDASDESTPANPVFDAVLPTLFYDDMPYRPVSEQTLDACVAAINACSRAAVQVTRGEDDLCVWAVESTGGVLRLLVRNDRHTRTEGTIDLPRPILHVHYLNSATGKPIVPIDHLFHFTVPARGTAVFDVTFAETN